MPIAACSTLPVLISWATTVLTVLDGIENPTPTLPLSRPTGLDLCVHPDHLAACVDQRAAGVAVVDRRVRLDHVVDLVVVRRRISRWIALTIPAVTVRLRPNGLPIATTESPTWTRSELPSVRE